ncbi:hypothetical protein [Geoglobus ahangari]
MKSLKEVAGLVLVLVVLAIGGVSVTAANTYESSEPTLNIQSASWITVLETAYNLYDIAMNLLWSEDPVVEYGSNYVTAKTGTVEFNSPFTTEKIFAVDKIMPGWAGYDLEVHGNNYRFGDIIVVIYGDQQNRVGSAKLTHNQYYWVTAPKTLPTQGNPEAGVLICVD